MCTQILQIRNHPWSHIKTSTITTQRLDRTRNHFFPGTSGTSLEPATDTAVGTCILSWDPWERDIWLWINTYKYHFEWDEHLFTIHQGYKVLTHPHFLMWKVSFEDQGGVLEAPEGFQSWKSTESSRSWRGCRRSRDPGNALILWILVFWSGNLLHFGGFSLIFLLYSREIPKIIGSIFFWMETQSLPHEDHSLSSLQSLPNAQRLAQWGKDWPHPLPGLGEGELFRNCSKHLQAV